MSSKKYRIPKGSEPKEKSPPNIQDTSGSQGSTVESSTGSQAGISSTRYFGEAASDPSLADRLQAASSRSAATRAGIPVAYLDINVFHCEQ